jgi:hypothetical protein
MFFGSAIANVNPETGIRYGVTHKIPSWVFDDAMSWECPDEVDALAEYARDLLVKKAENGEIGPDDIDGFTPDKEEDNRETLADYIRGLDSKASSDLLAMVDGDAWNEYPGFWGSFDFSESARLGESDGIKMMLGGLGGAPLLWILDSPYLDTVRLCSPCVPNAGDLDSPDGNGYQCYAPCPDWYGEEDASLFD